MEITSNLSTVHTSPSTRLWQWPNVSVRFIAMLVTPPYQALCPSSHSSKDNAGCIEQAPSHLCTTLPLYLISLLSTPLADFLLIDQPAASSSLVNRVCIRSFFTFYCQMLKYINLIGGLPSRHLLFSRCVFLLIPLRYPDLSDTSHVIHARSGFENRIRLSGDRVRY